MSIFEPISPPAEITNLITNPSLGGGLTGFSSSAGAPTIAISTEQALIGTESLKITTTAAGTSVVLSSPGAVVAGLPYLAAFEVYAGTTSRNVGCQIDWYRTNGSWISTSSLHFATADLGFWERRWGSAVAPAEVATARLEFVVTGAAVGESFYMDAAMLAHTTLADLAYFDGDSENSRWLGTPHASASAMATSIWRAESGDGLRLEGAGPFDLTQVESEIVREGFVRAGVLREL